LPHVFVNPLRQSKVRPFSASILYAKLPINWMYKMFLDC
jgi:hypothetical protein